MVHNKILYIIFFSLFLFTSCFEGFKEDYSSVINGCCEFKGYGFEFEGYYIYDCTIGECPQIGLREGEEE